MKIRDVISLIEADGWRLVKTARKSSAVQARE